MPDAILLIEGFPAEKKATPTTTAYKRITQPSSGRFYVRFGRKQYPFVFVEHGSKKAALKAALIFRNQNEPPKIEASRRYVERLKPRSRATTSTKKFGVSRVPQVRSSVREAWIVYIAYSINYTVDHRDGTKSYRKVTLHCGREDMLTAKQDIHAYLTACYIRDVFEASLGSRKAFNPKAYGDWRYKAYYNKKAPVDWLKL